MFLSFFLIFFEENKSIKFQKQQRIDVGISKSLFNRPNLTIK